MSETAAGASRRNASVAVVGAGDYIGAAIARRFAREGYVVQCGRRDGEKLAPPVAWIDAEGSRGTFGSPTSFVGKEIWFGKDRLRDVEDYLSRAAGGVCANAVRIPGCATPRASDRVRATPGHPSPSRCTAASTPPPASPALFETLA